ncbi:MAG: toxin YoeB [Flavobacteriaceae bacterium]|jgi:toxin YoeB
MKLIWLTRAWEDYLCGQQNETKTLKIINKLIEGIQRTPFTGIGNPEALKHNLSGWRSRRINLDDRLVSKGRG